MGKRKAQWLGVALTLAMCLTMPHGVLAAGGSPAPHMADDIQSIALEIAGIGVAITAACVTLAVALGGLEVEIGEGLSMPGLQASVSTRVVVCILSFVIAVSAVPISNAVVSAAEKAGFW